MKMKDICKLDLPNIPVRKNNYFRKIYESIITSLIAFNIILFIIPNINSVILNLIFSIICVATSMFITNKIANKIQVFCFYNFEVKKIKALGYEICNECDGYGFQKFENKMISEYKCIDCEGYGVVGWTDFLRKGKKKSEF